MEVVLTPKLKEFVEAKVRDGSYANASEVMREALRLLQEQESTRKSKLERLRREIDKGEADFAAGRGTIINSDEELAALFKGL